MATTDTVKHTPRIGCLGVGSVGRQRMQSVIDQGVANVVAVADPDPRALCAAAEIAPHALLIDEPDAMLDVDLDGVMIATPSAMHAEQVTAHLALGRSVFCQKPLARSPDETEAVLRAAQRADRLLAVDLSYRYVSGVAAMRDLVQSGGIGHLFGVSLTFHSARGPDKSWFYDRSRSGGGCLVDLGMHLVDLALWVSGSPSAYVVDARCFAHGMRLSRRDRVEDYVCTRLDLDAGASMTLTCSWNLHTGRDAIIGAEFHGTEGSVVLRNVGGSLHDFMVEHHQRTTTRVLARPPDAWSGRCAAAWAEALGRSPRYDPRIESIRDVARILDRIYGNPSG
jgi:predicted dehydrogenase